MLHHHDGRSYEIAAGEAAVKAREKFEGIIAKGRQKSQQAIADMLTEYQIRQDFLAPGHSIKFALPEENALVPFNMNVGDRNIQLTNFSTTQLLEKLGLPKLYVDRLIKIKEPWAQELLVENLQRLAMKNVADERLLFRVVGETAKGILSANYRRMDASPIFEAFLTTAMNQGYVPIDGMNTDTRYHLKMIKDVIYEPAKNEVVAFGAGLTTSDYGNGALQLAFFILRLWCTNFAIAENLLRKVHLGKRFDGEDNGYEVLSQKTYDLDTKTVASAVNDIMKIGFEKQIDETCGLIANAAEKDIDVRKALEGLQKKGILNKEQSKTAETLYENVNEINMLPDQKGVWRFANVLSLMANNDKVNGDKAIELQSEAYELLKAA